jgi:hypothetical protein
LLRFFANDISVDFDASSAHEIGVGRPQVALEGHVLAVPQPASNDMLGRLPIQVNLG